MLIYIFAQVREMASENTPPAVRSNAVIVLGDLCVRYTALVERHVPAMAARLQVYIYRILLFLNDQIFIFLFSIRILIRW